MSKLAILGATVSALALSGAADATVLAYTLTGTDFDGSIEYSRFYLDQKPTVSSSTGFFEIDDVAGFYSYTYADTSKGVLSSTINDLHFYASDAGFYNGSYFPGLGTLFDSAGILDIFTPLLYTGSVSAPTMKIGEFTVYDYFTGASLHLSVQAVPEPASWMMMIGGFGMIGGAMRSRRSRIGYAKA